MNPIAIRLLAQQLAAPQFTDPATIVAHMGAIQAQDYRMMRWAVALRTRRPTAKAFKDAYNEGRIVRLHLLRGTWQLITAKDYGWMMSLCATMAERTIKGWMKTNKVEIGQDELKQVRQILVKTCENNGSATKKDFAEALLSRGIVMDNHRLSYHIRLGELSGTLCSGELTMCDSTYALTFSKIKTEQIPQREEMLRRVTRKYFQSHSPATVEDFMWWSGLTRSECCQGLERIAGELEEEKYQGYRFFIHKDCRRRGYRKGSTLLLPPFDEYLVGYKSRKLVIEPHHIPQAYTNNGIFFPIIALNGKIIGNWKPWNKEPEATRFVMDRKDKDKNDAEGTGMKNGKKKNIESVMKGDIEKSWGVFNSIMET